ncbi:MAG: HAD family acid phosphatase [Ignavibacteriaceae bacterium]|nr:HAD family acid phosphatase [Ignavibacteriaceae bacterium]
MKHYKEIKIVFAILLSFTLVSCGTSLVNLQTAKKNVAKYYESGEYSNDVKKIISDAENDINKLDIHSNSAVVFDVDETSLSNYESIKKIYFGYDPVKWDNWINEAKAPAIPEVKQFYDFLLLKKIKIIFLSSRNSTQYDATYRNLKNVGYTEFDTLILKDNSDSSHTSLAFKSRQRELLTNKGYEIIADIGDQKSDLEGKDHGIQIKLPNYLYFIQ